LLQGLTRLDMTDSGEGWATYVTSDCSSGKDGCMTESGMLVTVDHGESWNQRS